MKAGFEARVRARKEKEKEREEREEQERKEEEERDMDFGGWSRKLRQEQEVRALLPRRYGVQALMEKIKDRARRKAALMDRKGAAARALMKNHVARGRQPRAQGEEAHGCGRCAFLPFNSELFVSYRPP